ncbi:DUF2975 domain-containing protein [Streptococcus hillyeri]|uniref:DUF2975 domain-containing protein n=1 Tax=Streptococcus hillyeri TaxID=2282420 RepID=A0A3L9DTJ0_9STRE|nr:DUF2975 domain-containing protein [Streptococcus hillyeri]RLY03588.1 DUF2975 domain-containing protein [Streptococcus hillyeri]
MTFVLNTIVALIVLSLVAVVILQIHKKNKPLPKREFGYLKWVIYLLNLLIVGLGLGAILGIIGLILNLFGLLDVLQEFLNVSGGQNGFSFSFEMVNQSPFATIVDMINMISVLGILICMRAFMKNIILEEIFIPNNVRLARLSTIFLVLGSLIRSGVDTSSIVMHGQYAEKTYEYSFFSLNYLLAAVLVWTMSIILEKAIAIAEENEFTI